MPTFDIVSEVNQVEVRNALDQANKEISHPLRLQGLGRARRVRRTRR